MSLTKLNSAFGEEPDDDSFWLKVMEECLEHPVTKLPTGKRLLVLGDNEAQKTVLVTRLQGATGHRGDAANFTRGNGLEYKHLTVKDEYCDNQTKLGVWILDGDPFYKPLLKYALDSDSVRDTTVLLVASMTKPWDIFDTITAWKDVLKNHIEGLGLSKQELESSRNKVLERFREYIEPGLSIYGSLAADNTRELSVNLGVEIIVVITRTEYMRELRTEFGYEEEHFDFLQFALREFCLEHGAALFYVSVKDDKNCDFLLKYLLHRVYSFPFRIPGVLVEPDSVLVPAGWDTRNKIKFLSDGMPTIPTSTAFEEVVFRPARLSDTKRIAPEAVALRDQEFLAELQLAMERQVSEERTSDAAKESSSMTATVVQRNVARRMTRAQAGRSPQKKMEAKLVSGEGDTTLSNFFHSLLNRRTSAPVDRPAGLPGGRTQHIPKTNAPETSTAQSGGDDGARAKMDFGRNPQGIAQLFPSRTLSSDLFENTEAEAGESSPPKLKDTAHPSSDQDKDTHPLPEYFMSNAEGGEACAADCSFLLHSDSAASSFELDDPPLDRVKSSFNPPLKLLLEECDFQTREVPGSKLRNVISNNGNGILENESASFKKENRTCENDGSSEIFKNEIKTCKNESEVLKNEKDTLKNGTASARNESETLKNGSASLNESEILKNGSDSLGRKSETTKNVLISLRNGSALGNALESGEFSLSLEKPGSVAPSMPCRMNDHDQNYLEEE